MTTMNIYELEKLATPGPLTWGRAGSFGRVSRWDICRDTQTVAVVHSVTGLESDPRKADAELLVHCRNHFMRALAALKQQRKYLAEYGHDKEAGLLHQLITELEEVKA